ncbi:MAG TPA: hypothetical protein VE287_09860 [Actinopolymorphaceae bacterium]|nr:hypothetical protein [Actinopolymorphaceae bacterium]
MTPLLRPVGPLATSVYWVRRMLVLLAAVLVGWLVVWALPGGASSGAEDAAAHRAKTGTSAGSHTPTTAAGRSGSLRTPDPTAGPTSRTTRPPAAVPASGHEGVPQFGVCSAGQLRVSVTIATTRVPSGTAVPVRVDIRNTATRCGLSLNATSLRVQVTSGSDLIWDTKQCPAFVRSKLLTIEPGNTHVATVTWPGTRSRDGCPSRQVTALPGYYAVQAAVAGIASDNVRLQIT